ncbi:vacuolar-sorting protein SNF8 [Neoconidiobolus thromboides FSU 785]|nr:vacuolar-sorting protein SNF8 [Neoconidiobolus thromboides FSU 785]
MSHRRIGAGKARLIRQKATEEQFKKTGENISASQLQDLSEQFDVFQIKLKEFSKEYEKQIKTDASFRQYFQKMCNQIGVDPLQSSKGFWSELLGVGEFYNELGLQIIEVCIKTRGYNGGLIEMEQLKSQLNERRSQSIKLISDDDVLKAIKTLNPLGKSYKLITIGDKKLISSVPKEFDRDQIQLLDLAQQHGYITLPMIQEKLSWAKERGERTINNLLLDGLCWVDSQSVPYQYWFISYFNV